MLFFAESSAENELVRLYWRAVSDFAIIELVDDVRDVDSRFLLLDLLLHGQNEIVLLFLATVEIVFPSTATLRDIMIDCGLLNVGIELLDQICWHIIAESRHIFFCYIIVSLVCLFDCLNGHVGHLTLSTSCSLSLLCSHG